MFKKNRKRISEAIDRQKAIRMQGQSWSREMQNTYDKLLAKMGGSGFKVPTLSPTELAMLRVLSTQTPFSPTHFGKTYGDVLKELEAENPALDVDWQTILNDAYACLGVPKK